MSATYTTSHGNSGFLTLWAGPGIEPVSSGILVSAEPQQELPNLYIYICMYMYISPHTNKTKKKNK